MPMLKKLIRDCGGNNLLEAAIVTPLLLMLTFGIVDFASLFWVYVSMESGISQATRFAVTGASKDDPDSPGTPMGREGTIKAAMQDAAPMLAIDSMTFSFSHMVPGSSSWASGAGGPGDIGRVAVEYSWQPLTPILAPFLGTDGKMTLHVESAMRIEPEWE
ncbi:MAG: pilus assembly protein [Acidobacteria bacterium]|nr:MAG: pilus assembly protein [Acidobacteriota bacterium]